MGLTGGIGAGKSTALALFEELGALTISADSVVHELYRRPELLARIVARFGLAVLDDDGGLDRVRLAAVVRGRRGGLRWLEQLTHPLVSEEIKRRVENAPVGAVVVCEVPLLFEAGYEALFDLVVTVEAGGETRRRRSVHGFDLQQFSEFERLQASSERRVEGSDLAFFNDGDLDQLREFVGEAYTVATGLLREER